MWCRLALAWQVKNWSLTSLQHRLVKADGQACPPLLAAADRGTSTPTLVWPHAEADLGAASA